LIDAYQKAEDDALIADITAVPENAAGSATALVNRSGKIKRSDIYSGTHIPSGSVYTPVIAMRRSDEIAITVDACTKEQVDNFVNTLPAQNIRYTSTCAISDLSSTGATALKIKGGASGIAMEDFNNSVFIRLNGGMNASMSVRADHEPNRTATLFFGTPYRYDDNSPDKCAIIMFHFG
jgi:hypothetical protein